MLVNKTTTALLGGIIAGCCVFGSILVPAQAADIALVEAATSHWHAGINLAHGLNRLSVSGQWVRDPGRGPIGPGGNGTPAGGDYPKSYAFEGEVLAKINGTTGVFDLIGHSHFCITGPGLVEFQMNDNHHSDNGGQLQVSSIQDPGCLSLGQTDGGPFVFARKSDWHSRIQLAPGLNRVSVKIVDVWVRDPGRGPIGPGGNGTPAGGDYPKPGAMEGELLARIRETGQVVDVIEHTRFCLNGPARIEFKMNDNNHGDNKGRLQIFSMLDPNCG